MKFSDIHLVSCHRLPERSFFFKGKQLPVCARCTGIYIGFFSAPLFLFDVIRFNLLITILLIFPAVIDGLTQAIFKRESNNILRVTTGFIYGVGIMSLASIIGRFVGNYIIELLQ